MTSFNRQIAKMFLAKKKPLSKISWDWDSEDEDKILDLSHVISFGNLNYDPEEMGHENVKIGLSYLLSVLQLLYNVGTSTVNLSIKKDGPLVITGMDDFVKLDFKGYIAPKIVDEEEDD